MVVGITASNIVLFLIHGTKMKWLGCHTMSIFERRIKSISFYCGADSVRWIGRERSCSLLLLLIGMKYARMKLSAQIGCQEIHV